MSPTPHSCVTFDGEPIRIGLMVLDYDNRLSVVVGAPPDYDPPCDGRGWSAYRACGKLECPHHPLSRGCWWDTVPVDSPQARPTAFDGSRMTTRGVEARRAGR